MSDFDEAMEGFDWDYAAAAKQFFEDYEGSLQVEANLRKRNSQNFSDLMRRCEMIASLEKTIARLVDERDAALKLGGDK